MSQNVTDQSTFITTWSDIFSFAAASFIRKVLLTSTYGPAFPVRTKQFL